MPNVFIVGDVHGNYPGDKIHVTFENGWSSVYPVLFMLKYPGKCMNMKISGPDKKHGNRIRFSYK